MTDSPQTGIPDWLQDSVETIFSWVILMPIAVIISGKILAKIVDFPVETEQVFRIPINILNIEAKNGEVILGFASFIITLTGIGVMIGKSVYLIVKTNVTTHPVKTTRSVSKGLRLLSLVVSHIERIIQKASEPPTARNPPVTLSLTFTGRTMRSA